MARYDTKKRVTRNDVAELAGVSPAVVSYVLNSSKYVSDERKEAVYRAIEELHYVPNVQARGLKTQRTMQIAFVCDNLRNDWLEIAETLLFNEGYYVSHCYARDGDPFINKLIERQFDGIFMMSNRYSTKQLNRLAEAGIPLILYKTRDYGELNPAIVTVVPNLSDAVTKSVNYLSLKGHRRIAFLLPVRYRSSGMESDGIRERAFKKALELNGISTEEAYLCSNTDSMESILTEVCNLIIEGGCDRRPTAIMASNDWMAGEVMKSIKRMGLRIPEDIAVMGEDNTYLAEMLSPTLTSVDFSKELFSRVLVEKLLKLMRGEKTECQMIDVVIKVRESA